MLYHGVWQEKGPQQLNRRLLQNSWSGLLPQWNKSQLKAGVNVLYHGECFNLPRWTCFTTVFGRRRARSSWRLGSHTIFSCFQGNFMSYDVKLLTGRDPTAAVEGLELHFFIIFSDFVFHSVWQENSRRQLKAWESHNMFFMFSRKLDVDVKLMTGRDPTAADEGQGSHVQGNFFHWNFGVGQGNYVYFAFRCYLATLQWECNTPRKA